MRRLGWLDLRKGWVGLVAVFFPAWVIIYHSSHRGEDVIF